MARVYLTTPIYYVNDVPHLGTAYTTIAVDALRRYAQVRGHDARMLTGTDEHGLKLERLAQERGIAPQAFVDTMAAPFREAWPKLGVATTDFIRTTEPRHARFVQALWKRVEERGFFYEGEYNDWYCVGCEAYKTEKELIAGENGELLCPTHKKPVEKLKERTIFFKLSEFQKPLLELYARRPDFVMPESRLNEVRSFVEGGLDDLSVSRTSFAWGIPVPDHAGHVMYVWFDALANYISALAEGSDGHNHLAYWPSANHDARAIHVVGKDILRFHAVYWPAFLLAAGYTDAELPTSVYAHGFLTVDGQKMSKSLRNAVSPLRLAEEFGADVLRYHLLRAIAFGQDGDFDHKALIERYNADLGKNLGNLLNRTLGLATKLTGGKAPAVFAPTALEDEYVTSAHALMGDALGAWDRLEIHRALEHTWALSSLANQYVDRAAPWTAAKTGDTARTQTIVSMLMRFLDTLSVLVWPVMPEASRKMRGQLALAPLELTVGNDAWKFAEPRATEAALPKADPLFPTIDKDAEAALLAKLLPQPAPEVPAAGPAQNPLPLAADPSVPLIPLTDYDTFAKLDLRVGLVRAAERVPKKDKLLKLTVDLGESEPRTIIAGLGLTFAPEALLGRRVVVVANLAPREFGKGLVSHGMLLASGASDALRLPTIDIDVEPGSKLK